MTCLGDTAMLDMTTAALHPYVTGLSGELSTEQLALIDEIVQAVRPGIQADGGDLELVAVTGDVVRIRLTGACTHCALAGQTLGGIRRQIVGRLGVPLRVLPAPLD
jgi:Fe-S cluster biogenesis protein NfuA